MNGKIQRASKLLVIVTMALLAGCGQSLRVRVTRLGTLSPSPTHPAARARAEVRNVAMELLVLCDLLSGATDARPGSIVATWETAVEDIRTALIEQPKDGAPLTVYETREKLQELRGVVAQMGSAEVLAQTMARGDPEKQAKLLPQIQSAYAGVKRAEIQAVHAVGEARETLEYGGFQDNTVYKIDAASKAHEKLAGRPRGDLFSEISIDLTGNTAAMIVQQRPAYFTMKGVRADPTEVLRNSLIMVNKALRIVSRFIPQLSSAQFGATPTGPAGGASAAGEIDPDAVAVDAAAAAIRELTTEPDVAVLLNKIKAGTKLEPDEEEQLLGRLRAVLALRGPGGG